MLLVLIDAVQLCCASDGWVARRQRATLLGRHGGLFGAYHLSRRFEALVHEARLTPVKYSPPLFEGTEKRLSRRRGGTTANDEVCRHQDHGSARASGAAPSACAAGQSAYWQCQSNPHHLIGTRCRRAAVTALSARRNPLSWPRPLTSHPQVAIPHSASLSWLIELGRQDAGLWPLENSIGAIGLSQMAGGVFAGRTTNRKA
jgi:hypothetical protein